MSPLDRYDDTQSPGDLRILDGFDAKGYVPLDAIMEQPSTRFLVALRRSSWLSSDVLYVRAGIARDENLRHFDRATKTLSRLAGSRYVSRRGTHGRFEYRITEAGKREIDRRLAGGVR